MGRDFIRARARERRNERARQRRKAKREEKELRAKRRKIPKGTTHVWVFEMREQLHRLALVWRRSPVGYEAMTLDLSGTQRAPLKRVEAKRCVLCEVYPSRENSAVWERAAWKRHHLKKNRENPN